ncbi:MAG TPA: hypothetical protein DEA26_09820 [Oceanospirillales bacterium]|nr:hypothetical protein [Oceanospirillales bacterium]
MGGAGSAVLEVLAAAGKTVTTEVLGIEDRFIEQDSPAKQRVETGIDATAILNAARRHLPEVIKARNISGS